jgi:hypothetical protein
MAAPHATTPNDGGPLSSGPLVRLLRLAVVRPLRPAASPGLLSGPLSRSFLPAVRPVPYSLLVDGALDDDLRVIRSSGLVTTRYASWKPGLGVPIRTTVGAPRFWRHGPLVFVKELAPFGIFGEDLPADVARRRYRERLEAKTEQFVPALADIARRHPGERQCVLCFEDVQAGQTCHRRWFAEWFEEQFGIGVPELIDLGQPEATESGVTRQLRLPL